MKPTVVVVTDHRDWVGLGAFDGENIPMAKLYVVPVIDDLNAGRSSGFVTKQ